MARVKTFDMNYYNTYYFANIIHNVINDNFEYLRKLSDFFETTMFLSDKFEKHSILHQFIGFVIDELFYESIDEELKRYEEVRIDEIKNKKFWINHALKHNGIAHESIKYWLKDYIDSKEHPEDLVYEYINEFLLDERIQLTEKLTNEVFYLMFMNRKFLLKFNYTVSSHVSFLTPKDVDDEIKKLFKKPGVLKRVNIPEWVKNAVFFRDRGHCVFCNADLTNIITRLSVKNFDHIVPLNQGGVNDVSNIQLTCETCNHEKLDKEIKTSNSYELWY
ncbi:HNH endonuclease [Paenibacillus thiaminolyticus]|uniref:HNH endonuclease n=1 Tax=Paenibacillus thiaminolyticus TaxID=49283 RepID=UPI00234FC3A9|nr:HNH endonuclease [Paenibacillus thiaminolyticus]WCR28781.1 HNH endonuclease [Paenibacillus thiaminolyticus]